MKISDLLKLSTDTLRRRKGRTALTVIGVVVGTCAIVVMISLGIATMTVSYVLCSVATLPIKEREYDASKVSAGYACAG